jgi:hypothetical protein
VHEIQKSRTDVSGYGDERRGKREREKRSWERLRVCVRSLAADKAREIF